MIVYSGGFNEDNVGGRFSNERFKNLSSEYETKQKQLTERTSIREAEFIKQGKKVIDAGKSLAVVRKYTNIQELMPTLLREFLDRIVVHKADKHSGKRQQKTKKHYNFVKKIGRSTENKKRREACASQHIRKVSIHIVMIMNP